MLLNPTKINPVLKLFASRNMSLSLIILIVILGIFLGMVVMHFSKKQYLKKGNLYKKVYIFLKECFLTIFSCYAAAVITYSAFAFYFDITNKNINTTPIKTAFSSYRIVKIKQPKESDSTITYDASGNIESEKPKTLFNVYLEKTKDVKTMELEYDVVLEVTKVNKDSFDIILPDDKTATIKKEDAPEVFNALKKIKDDKAWEEINRLMRNRQVKEE